MPIIATAKTGTITSIRGRATLRRPNGTTQELHVGDTVHKGDVVLTDKDSIVEMAHADTRVATSEAPLEAQAVATASVAQTISVTNL